MAAFARKAGSSSKCLTPQAAASMCQIAQRCSFSQSSTSSSANESFSRFWESSDDDDISLSGYSSRSDSDLFSRLSSSEREDYEDSRIQAMLPMKCKRSDSDSESDSDSGEDIQGGSDEEEVVVGKEVMVGMVGVVGMMIALGEEAVVGKEVMVVGKEVVVVGKKIVVGMVGVVGMVIAVGKGVMVGKEVVVRKEVLGEVQRVEGRAVINSHMKTSSLKMPKVSQHRAQVSLNLPSSGPLKRQVHTWLVKGIHQHWACLKVFFYDVAIDRVEQSTLSYAEQNKECKKGRYNLFK